MKMIVMCIWLLLLCRMSRRTQYAFADTLNNDHIQFTVPASVTSGVITSFDIATTFNAFPVAAWAPPPGTGNNSGFRF
jgi:hypothetical protein